MDFSAVSAALKKNNYEVRCFATKEEAADYLTSQIQNATVGFGDSMTLTAMGLEEKLSRTNTVHNPNGIHDLKEFVKVAKRCLDTDYYLTSVNGMSETGVLVNLDGTGNRVAASLFGHKKVYFVVGRNKIAPTLEDAIWRVRNVAAPANARRHGYQTPCALRGDRCYDCSSPDRICNGLLIEYKKMRNIEMEVVLIDEDLGL